MEVPKNHSATPDVPLATVVCLALYEDKTDMCLNVYLLVCAKEVLFTMSACA